MVHPGEARDRGAVEGAFHRKAREGDVVRCVARAFRGLADAIFPVNHERLARRQAQVEAHSFGHCRERLRARRLVPSHFPIAVPDAGLVEAGARYARSGSVQPLAVAETDSVDIGQRQVRQVQIVHAPCGGIVRGAAALPLPEEDQLESVAMSVARAEVPSVIPPLGAKVGVVELVARELIVVAGEGGTPGRRGEKECQDQERKRHRLIRL